MDNSHLVFSLKEARKILGKNISNQLSDEQLDEAIKTMALLARSTLRTIWEDENKLLLEEIES